MSAYEIATIERGGRDVVAGDLVGRRQRLPKKCRCGQELDVCTRSHCPRCGSNLPRH